MKKIPCLFKKQYEGKKYVGVTPEVTPGFEWVLKGEGVATIKFDGACCAFFGGNFYKRYSAKVAFERGKDDTESGGVFKLIKYPKYDLNRILWCYPPDPVTGHLPVWVPVHADNPEDRWFVEAANNAPGAILDYDWTYEACGPHFNGNPQGFDTDVLIPHGAYHVDVERSFEGIRENLRNRDAEGLVFWKDGKPQCKIKRTDFGFGWPIALL